MSLNIKSAAVHELARKVAVETGTSMTAAIETALKEKLERLEKQKDVEARIARLKAMTNETGPPPPGLTSDHSDWYDDNLPKRSKEDIDRQIAEDRRGWARRDALHDRIRHGKV